MPSTRPEQVFIDGLCDACSSNMRKQIEIDWSERESQFLEILKRYRGDGSNYDCVIPVSGGKDSCYQALTMRDKYGMTPLCVNHIPCELTETGQQNLNFLRDQGFDLIQVGADRRTYKELVRIGFSKLGDCCWPEHIGIFTVPVRVAVQYKVPLLIWGENSQFEYGGPASHRENNFLDRNWLEQFQMSGYRISDLEKNDGVNIKNVKVLTYPSDEELTNGGITGLFLGYYEKWDSIRNFETVSKLGWQKNSHGPVEGAYNDIENLDCKWVGGLHDYMKFLKFGYGRATDQICIEIRNGRISRSEGVEALGKTSEGKIPWRYIPDFLLYTGYTEEEFFSTLDRFTNKSLFQRDGEGNLLKDSKGNVFPKYRPS